MKIINKIALLFVLVLMFSCAENSTEVNETEPTVETENEETKEASPSTDFLVEKDLGDGVKSMKGILSSVGETGQEPMEYNLNISNGLDEQGEGYQYEAFELWIEAGKFEEVLEWESDYQFKSGTFDRYKNKVIEVRYTEEIRPRAVDVLSAKPNKLEEGVLMVEGTLKEVWEHGDGPGSLVLTTSEEKELSFEGDYQVEMEAEHQAMKGQKVFLLYQDIRQKLYSSAKIIGDYKPN